MKKIEKELNNEKLRIGKRLDIINTALKVLKHDKAKVKVIARNKSVQCYIKESEKDGLNGRYLPASQRARAINIVKAEYYNKLKEALEKRSKIIDKSIACLEETDPLTIYEKLGKGKQKLVEPIEISDEDYRKKWENCEYVGKPFEENASEIYTDRGERVRSKSEKIIADKLHKEGIAYRYECPLEIPFVGNIYPDFTILDESNRRNIIYEHFGLMDNENYANNAIHKLKLYTSEGYVLGDNLFITMETSSHPFDSRMIDGIIKQIKNN